MILQSMEEEEEAQQRTEDEVGSPSEQTDASPTGRRSYECVFCKRGFSTAQALGGHMNIHRRDRPDRAGKPSSAKRLSTSAPELTAYRHYHPYSSHSMSSFTYLPTADQSSAYATRYRPTTTATAAAAAAATTTTAVEAMSDLELHGEDNRVKELDLELRLGYPW